MIPSDLAARLRTLTEASFFNTDPPVPGLQRARAIQSQLPDLVPGARFFATLQRALPDGTFNAVVAGRQMTLALNSSAQPGDTLELEVTQTTPRAVFARVLGTETPQPNTANASAQPSLSSTGRLISFLLTGQPEAQPARLADNRPLLPTPPTTPTQTAQLVPMLRQAVSQSGMFYESHQVQWVLGKLETAALLREPQGQASAQASQTTTTTPGANVAAALPTGLPSAATGVPSGTGSGLANALAGLLTGGQAALSQAAAQVDDTAPSNGEALRSPQTAGNQATPADKAPANATTTGPGGDRIASNNYTQANATTEQAAQPRAGAQPIPERLLPVVHQQLDALATQQYVWQGQAWPGQPMEWIIEDPERDGAEGEAAEANWNTTLRLTLPRLGGVEASLHLTPAGVAMRLRADEEALQALDSGAAALASALEAANLKLTGLVVERREPPPAASTAATQ